jgi:hypothetical protein
MSAIHFSTALSFYIVLNIPDFQSFLIAPFDSKHDFESGQFERINNNELVSRLKKSDTAIDGCSKISLAERFTDVYPSRNKYGKDIGLLEIRLKDCIVNCSVQIRFENNRIYLYEWGTGVLVTQVSVTPHNITSASALKELEKEINEIFRQQFLRIVRVFIHEFALYASDMHFNEMPLRTHDNSEFNLAWIHTIYCFWGSDYFKADMGVMGWELNNDMVREFSNLLHQVPEDMSPAPERYVFYGWGSSLIVIKHHTLREHLDTIYSIIFLMQIIQNISLALYQLESTLNEKIYEIKPDRSEMKKGTKTYDERHSEIMNQISGIQQTRNSTFRFLEQFHYRSNVLIQNSDRLLLEKLENQWKLGDLESTITNKLNILEDRLREKSQFLYSKEQHDSLMKQDTLSKLFLWLTLVSLIGVSSQLVLLDPVNSLLSHRNFFWSHFFWALLLSFVIIMLVVFIYSAKIRNRIPHFRS